MRGLSDFPVTFKATDGELITHQRSCAQDLPDNHEWFVFSPMIIVNPTRKETSEKILFFQFLEIQVRKSMKSFQYSNLLKQSESYVGSLPTTFIFVYLAPRSSFLFQMFYLVIFRRLITTKGHLSRAFRTA